MFELDGAKLEMGGREFTYDVPAPFGPKRGAATLKVVARPAASVNGGFRAALDRIMHTSKVKDLTSEKNFKNTGDVEAYVTARDEDAKWARKKLAELNFDHCIIEWETNIQSAGADLAATRENFLALSEFEHPAITTLFASIQDDLTAFDKFSLDAQNEVDEAEQGN